MRRPNYGAVTGVVTALSVLAFVRIVLERAIPPPNPEIATWGQGEFVSRAADQAIEWRRQGPEAFVEARRLARPVFLVIGVPWSADGRRADETLALPEVARTLNHGFVPIRIDASQEPNWISEFLPFGRAKAGVRVGYQAWVFDLHGNLIDAVGPIDAPASLDGRSVVDALVNAQALFAATTTNDELPATEAEQREDARRLLDLTVANLSLSDAATTLAGRLDPEWGGWAEPDGQGAPNLLYGRPLAVRFLQLGGRVDEAGDALRRTVLSAHADWLDGGLFRILRRSARMPDYDKVATTNAQFAEALAVQDAMRPDPLLREAAGATASWLLSIRDDGLVAAAERGDENEQGRSARATFSPARLREAFSSGALSPQIRDWALGHLRLDDAHNPARVAVPLPDESDLNTLRSALSALRTFAGPHRPRAAKGLVDVNGTVAACLLRCARLWNDPRLAAEAGSIVDRMEVCRNAQNGVRHSLVLSPTGGEFLGDALGYADANLEDFLTNGRVPSLQRGGAVLRHALERFKGDAPGILRPSPESAEVFFHHPSLAQVTDDEGEASSAMALRLLVAYAAVLGPSGADLESAAANVAERLGAVGQAVPVMGGTLAALTRYADSRAVFVGGLDAVAHARRLARRFPSRLVVPLVGPYRTDLRNRPPGVYLGTSSTPSGPWTDDEAAARLSANLATGS